MKHLPVRLRGEGRRVERDVWIDEPRLSYWPLQALSWFRLLTISSVLAASRCSLKRVKFHQRILYRVRATAGHIGGEDGAKSLSSPTECCFESKNIRHCAGE